MVDFNSRLAAKDSRCTLSAILNLIASETGNLVAFARVASEGDKTSYITNRFF